MSETWEARSARLRTQIDPKLLMAVESYAEATRYGNRPMQELAALTQISLYTETSTTLAMSTPWGVPRIVERLADAADHLLDDHSCDVHGHEGIAAARDAGREWLNSLGMTREGPSPFDPYQGVHDMIQADAPPCPKCGTIGLNMHATSLASPGWVCPTCKYVYGAPPKSPEAPKEEVAPATAPLRVTVSFAPCFELRIQGQRVPQPKYDASKDTHGLGPLPRHPDDGGKVHAFVRWLNQSGIQRVGTAYQQGAGMLVAHFELADLPRILLQCREMGLDLVDPGAHP